MFYGQLLFLLGEQPVYGLKTHSLQDNSDRPTTIHTQVETLAAAYVKEIRQLQPNGSYLIAGRVRWWHSCF